jgi:hypothetical protein
VRKFFFCRRDRKRIVVQFPAMHAHHDRGDGASIPYARSLRRDAKAVTNRDAFWSRRRAYREMECMPRYAGSSSFPVSVFSTFGCTPCRLSLISRRLQSAQKRRRRAVNRRCLEAMVRGLLLFLLGVATQGGSPFFIAISTLSFTRKSCCPAALQALA